MNESKCMHHPDELVDINQRLLNIEIYRAQCRYELSPQFVVEQASILLSLFS